MLMNLRMTLETGLSQLEFLSSQSTEPPVGKPAYERDSHSRLVRDWRTSELSAGLFHRQELELAPC